MKIKLKHIAMQNFKSVHSIEHNLDSNKIIVTGGNASGKTTLYEAYYWCLFGKTLTPNGTVQTLDANNNVIHKVETSVEITLNIDEEYDITIKRVLCEKWRASGTSEEKLECTEVQRYWNGVPLSMAKYKQKLSELFQIETWQMLSIVGQFMNMKMEDRRKYLMMISGGMDEFALAKKYAAITEAFNKKKTIQELYEQSKSELQKAKKELEEIPARLAAQDNLKVDVKEEDLSDAGLLEEYLYEEQRLEKQYRSTLSRVEGEHNKNLRKLSNKREELSEKLRRLERQLILDDKEQTERISKLDSITADFNRKKEAWINENNSSFEFKASSICPVCGSILSEEVIAEHKEKAVKEFNKNKSEKLEKLLGEAEKLSLQKTVLTSAINQYKDVTRPAKWNEIDLIKKDISETESSYKIEAKIQPVSHPDVISAEKELSDWKTKRPKNADDIIKIKSDKEINSRIEAEKERLNKRSLALASIISNNNNILEQIRLFKKEKITFIENKVNKMFNLVTWKFYEQNISNDSEKEICTCIIDGKDYVNLNQAMKINANVDIIDGISKAIGTHVPMWIDGCESVTDITESVSQQIQLRVVDNQNLTITL